MEVAGSSGPMGLTDNTLELYHPRQSREALFSASKLVFLFFHWIKIKPEKQNNLFLKIKIKSSALRVFSGLSHK